MSFTRTIVVLVLSDRIYAVIGDDYHKTYMAIIMNKLFCSLTAEIQYDCMQVENVGDAQ